MQKCVLTMCTYIVTDKTDSTFCRSQSSSASSLDNIVAKEAIQCLTFAESFARKSGKVNKMSCQFVSWCRD